MRTINWLRRRLLVGERGLTLVEVVVGVAVLALGALMIGGTLTNVWRADASSDHAARAMFLARGELDYRRATGDLALGSHDCVVTGEGFDCRVAISEAAGVREVTATVKWRLEITPSSKGRAWTYASGGCSGRSHHGDDLRDGRRPVYQQFETVGGRGRQRRGSERAAGGHGSHG